MGRWFSRLSEFEIAEDFRPVRAAELASLAT
jgi:hypothetical protein